MDSNDSGMNSVAGRTGEQISSNLSYPSKPSPVIVYLLPSIYYYCYIYYTISLRMKQAPISFAQNEKIAELKGQYPLFFEQLRIYEQGRTITITLPPESSFKQHNIHLIRYQQDVLEQSYRKGKVIVSQAYLKLQQARYQFFISKFRLEIRAKFIPKELNYSKSQRIGKGGFGECYKISGNSQLRCAKVVKFKIRNQNQQIQDDRQRRYFYIMDAVRQVGICKLLGFLDIGPSILSVRGFDLLVYDDCVYYEMELCKPCIVPIGDLDHDKKRNVVLKKVKEDLVQNVYLLHSLKLVHRDIKPDNTLYSQKRDKYVFCDFGLTHSVKQNWHQDTLVREFAGTKHFVCQKMKILIEKRQKNQQIAASEKMVNLYYNDQFALHKTIQEYFEREPPSYNSQKKHNKYFDPEEQRAVSQFQNLQFLKGVYGYNLYILVYWRQHFPNHVPGLDDTLKRLQILEPGMPNELQQLQQYKKYNSYVEKFGARYFAEELDKLEILSLQRGSNKQQQSSSAITIYLKLLTKCADGKLLLRALQYVQRQQLFLVLAGTYSPVQLQKSQERPESLAKWIQWILNKSKAIQGDDKMLNKFSTLCHKLLFQNLNNKHSYQQMQKKFKLHTQQFKDLITEFYSQKKLQGLLSLCEIAVRCFLNMKPCPNDFYCSQQNRLLLPSPEEQYLKDVQLAIKVEAQLYAPFDILMKLKRDNERYYELSTLKFYCKMLLLYSQHKLSGREMIPKLLDEAEKLYIELCKRDVKRDAFFQYTPEAGILNMFKGTVYKLYLQKREKALESSFEALQNITEHYGQQNYYVPQIKRNIAQISEEMGQYALARQFYLEAVQLVFEHQCQHLKTVLFIKHTSHLIKLSQLQDMGQMQKADHEDKYVKFLMLMSSNLQQAFAHIKDQLFVYYRARRQKNFVGMSQQQQLTVEFIRSLNRGRLFFKYEIYDQIGSRVQLFERLWSMHMQAQFVHIQGFQYMNFLSTGAAMIRGVLG